LEKIIVGLESLLESILLALPRYVIGLLVLVVGIYVSGFIVKIIGRRFAKRDLDKSLQGFLLSAIRLMLYIVLFVVVIGIMGFKSLSLTAVFGAAGLTVGMALQGSLSNFAGGVLILMFRPFKVGDYITNTGGTVGTVEKIDLLYTTLTNDDGLKIFSPNGALANSVITNYSGIPARRYDFVVGISYKANIKEAQEVIFKVLNRYDVILKKPEPLVYVKNLSASSVDLNLRFWINRADYWDMVFKIQQEVKEALDQAGIEIPFPQTDIHIISDNKEA
jgi:small conductance mechanosensitive channel